MRVYYASMTGNVRRFIQKTGLDTTDISCNPNPKEPFVLVTYTFGFGAVPKEVDAWLTQNYKLLKGVAVSGNRNWGDNYGKAGDLIARKYNVPLLHKFELAGTDEDVQIFNERLLMVCDTTN
ncbi:class Ib ribonucleoside-diphosphate reductase assembly flavoprotein NrdI [Lysinibacillus capsici]|uniref:class Ib ribonucleoside-diphosphate reductase assembly flavoprotein NrdI n=1 Tax=Lysinibacillus capsici TaxID=2115968 RepID=UPI000E20C4EC|nr:class Ib ribonucleoside-diphosphate reductase assembly flavoprotein NrdI [Lysinibacillus capsici]RDV27754.1 class Ib ribonucleoside-diphosphate reductase assembly flavoprotein NrdI [Lysinibacillus capsici]